MAETEHVHLYDRNIPFKNCSCPDCQKHTYAIDHKMKPLDLPDKLVKAIEVLLWYSPNISSEQSFTNEYLKDSIFEEAVMTYFLRFANLTSEDILFVEDEYLSKDILSPYVNRACSNCQKIIVKKNKKETRINCILRHMRNCLAHGKFNFIIEDNIIGFDSEKDHKTKVTKYTAIFKLDIITLYDFCRQLIQFPDFTVSHIIQYLLFKNKYTVLSEARSYTNREGKRASEELVFTKKGKRTYRINCSRYIVNEWSERYRAITELTPDYDEDFNLQTQYINVFYTEQNIGDCLKIDDSTYMLSKEGLKKYFSTSADDN